MFVLCWDHHHCSNLVIGQGFCLVERGQGLFCVGGRILGLAGGVGLEVRVWDMGGGKGQGGAATTMNTPLQSYDELVNRRSELIKVIHTHLLCVLELFCMLCACVLLCDWRPFHARSTNTLVLCELLCARLRARLCQTHLASATVQCGISSGAQHDRLCVVHVSSGNPK